MFVEAPFFYSIYESSVLISLSFLYSVSILSIDNYNNAISIILYTQTDGKEKEFTVLSWNIDGLEESNFFDRLLGTIREINVEMPDVVLLQEVVEETYINLVFHLET